MVIKNNLLSLVQAVTVLVMFSLFNFAYAERFNIGDEAPGFSLLNQSSQEISLQTNRGQWVVLYFYPKDDTPGCTTEACSFRDNINRLIKQKAVVIGVSLDSVASHQAFAKEYKLPFDLLADVDGAVSASYGALLDLKIVKFAKRHSFIIDPQGKIAKIYRNVNPDTHVREVMKDLAELQAQG